MISESRADEDGQRLHGVARKEENIETRPKTKLLRGGGTVDPAGNVYFAWDGYTQNGQTKGPVNLRGSG